MSVYDVSFTNSTNPVELTTGVNTATGGIIGTGFCVMIYFVIIKGASDNNYDVAAALLASSLILSIISGILLGIGLIPDYVLGINSFVLVGSIFVKIFGGR